MNGFKVEFSFTSGSWVSGQYATVTFTVGPEGPQTAVSQGKLLPLGLSHVPRLVDSPKRTCLKQQLWALQREEGPPVSADAPDPPKQVSLPFNCPAADKFTSPRLTRGADFPNTTLTGKQSETGGTEGEGGRDTERGRGRRRRRRRRREREEDKLIYHRVYTFLRSCRDVTQFGRAEGNK